MKNHSQVKECNGGIVSSNSVSNTSSQQNEHRRMFPKSNLSRKAQGRKRRRMHKKSKERMERRKRAKAMKQGMVPPTVENCISSLNGATLSGANMTSEKPFPVCENSRVPLICDDKQSNTNIVSVDHVDQLDPCKSDVQQSYTQSSSNGNFSDMWISSSCNISASTFTSFTTSARPSTFNSKSIRQPLPHDNRVPNFMSNRQIGANSYYSDRLHTNGFNTAPYMSRKSSLPHTTKGSLPQCGSSSDTISTGLINVNDRTKTTKMMNMQHSSDSYNKPMMQVISELQSSDLPSPDKYVALDCEFVEITKDHQRTNGLARCSIVDYDGCVVFDVYVKPEGTITDFRTRYSGIKPHHMRNAIPFKNARLMVVKAIQDKIVIGHAVMNDFKVLRIFPPSSNIRDTSHSILLRQLANFDDSNSVSLKRLTFQLLGYRIQCRSHCSVEDARATMSLFKLVRLEWERKVANNSRTQPVMQRELSQRNNNNRSISESSEDYLGNDRYWPS